MAPYIFGAFPFAWICGMPSGCVNHNHSPCGHDLLRATSVLFAQLAFWLDKARRLVDSLKRPSAMAEHAKLGVRLNRMGCEDGRKILENPYTSDNNPRYWKNTLCDLCASQVALDLFHGLVSFFLGQLVFCLKSPSKRTRWQIHRPQRWGS